VFETALEKAGVPPARAVMVGDRYSYAEGATDAGLTAIAYGASDGPAVDYRASELTEIPGLLGFGD